MSYQYSNYQQQPQQQQQQQQQQYYQYHHPQDEVVISASSYYDNNTSNNDISFQDRSVEPRQLFSDNHQLYGKANDAQDHHHQQQQQQRQQQLGWKKSVARNTNDSPTTTISNHALEVRKNTYYRRDYSRFQHERQKQKSYSEPIPSSSKDLDTSFSSTKSQFSHSFYQDSYHPQNSSYRSLTPNRTLSSSPNQSTDHSRLNRSKNDNHGSFSNLQKSSFHQNQPSTRGVYSSSPNMTDHAHTQSGHHEKSRFDSSSDLVTDRTKQYNIDQYRHQSNAKQNKYDNSFTEVTDHGHQYSIDQQRGQTIGHQSTIDKSISNAMNYKYQHSGIQSRNSSSTTDTRHFRPDDSRDASFSAGSFSSNITPKQPLSPKSFFKSKQPPSPILPQKEMVDHAQYSQKPIARSQWQQNNSINYSRPPRHETIHSQMNTSHDQSIPSSHHKSPRHEEATSIAERIQHFSPKSPVFYEESQPLMVPEEDGILTVSSRIQMYNKQESPVKKAPNSFVKNNKFIANEKQKSQHKHKTSDIQDRIQQMNATQQRKEVEKRRAKIISRNQIALNSSATTVSTATNSVTTFDEEGNGETIAALEKHVKMNSPSRHTRTWKKQQQRNPRESNTSSQGRPPIHNGHSRQKQVTKHYEQRTNTNNEFAVEEKNMKIGVKDLKEQLWDETEKLKSPQKQSPARKPMARERKDVAHLVARLNAISRDDPKLALEAIDSILKSTQNKQLEEEEEERLESDSGSETSAESSVSSITNPTYQSGLRSDASLQLKASDATTMNKNFSYARKKKGDYGPPPTTCRLPHRPNGAFLYKQPPVNSISNEKKVMAKVEQPKKPVIGTKPTQNQLLAKKLVRTSRYVTKHQQMHQSTSDTCTTTPSTKSCDQSHQSSVTPPHGNFTQNKVDVDTHNVGQKEAETEPNSKSKSIRGGGTSRENMGILDRIKLWDDRSCSSTVNSKNSTNRSKSAIRPQTIKEEHTQDVCNKKANSRSAYSLSPKRPLKKDSPRFLSSSNYYNDNKANEKISVETAKGQPNNTQEYQQHENRPKEQKRREDISKISSRFPLKHAEKLSTPMYTKCESPATHPVSPSIMTGNEEETNLHHVPRSYVKKRQSTVAKRFSGLMRVYDS